MISQLTCNCLRNIYITKLIICFWIRIYVRLWFWCLTLRLNVFFFPLEWLQAPIFTFVGILSTFKATSLPCCSFFFSFFASQDLNSWSSHKFHQDRHLIIISYSGGFKIPLLMKSQKNLVLDSSLLYCFRTRAISLNILRNMSYMLVNDSSAFESKCLYSWMSIILVFFMIPFVSWHCTSKASQIFLTILHLITLLDMKLSTLLYKRFLSFA